METFDLFNLGKAQVLRILEELAHILADLKMIDVDVEDDCERVRNAMAAVDSDVLRIALLGAFSDGKTSVVAGWLGRLMADMKIDMDESSDRLAVYQPEGLPGKCEIVDTPGLFGDKERTVDEHQLMYSDITRRYIAEAHLVLYVVEAKNPLKDSQFDVVRWVLRDLGKLSSTIFVINKMDAATDLTDPTLFTDQARIKRENLVGKLRRAVDLSSDELARLNVVCIAANPNGKGLLNWFGKPEQYESRSRIGDLKSATERVLRANVPAVLRAKTGLDVVRDTVAAKSAEAKRELDTLAGFRAVSQESIKRVDADLKAGLQEVKRLAGMLGQELDTLDRAIMGRLRSLEMADILPFVEDEIGYRGPDDIGYKLQLAVKRIVDKYFAQATTVTGQLGKTIEIQVSNDISFLDTIGGAASDASAKMLRSLSGMSATVIKDGIFAARDLLSTITGYTYKFKPWGATKLAGTISKWAGPAGGALQLGTDLYAAYKTSEREKQLAEIKKDLGDGIKQVFGDFYKILQDDEKLVDFLAPQLNEFQAVLGKLRHSEAELESRSASVERIAQRLQQLLQAPSS